MRSATRIEPAAQRRRALTSRLPLPVLAFMAWLLAVTPAAAHWADMAAASITADGARADVSLTLSTRLLAQADADGDGRLSGAEIRVAAPWLRAQVRRRLVLTSRGAPGEVSISPTQAVEAASGFSAIPGQHSTLLVDFAWRRPVRDSAVRYDFFLDGVPTQRCLVTADVAGAFRSEVLVPTRRAATLVGAPSPDPLRGQQRFALLSPSVRLDTRLRLGAPSPRGRGAEGGGPTLLAGEGGGVASGRLALAGTFANLGIWHIFSGYDHILFLLSLLMLGGGLGYLLKIVTSFTVAHSVTLTLAALNIVTLPSRIVESAIALSIIYVAAENFWRKTLDRRWMLTFGFGLIHGLGFASALREYAIPAGALPVALVSFNVGVEIGQVVIVTTAFLLLSSSTRFEWHMAFRRWSSGVVIAVAAYWFVQRAFLGGA